MRAGKSRHWLIEPRPSCRNTRVGPAAAAAMRRYSRRRPRTLMNSDGLDAGIDETVPVFFGAATLPESLPGRRRPHLNRRRLAVTLAASLNNNDEFEISDAPPQERAVTAQIIDGKRVAQTLRTEWKLRADRLNAAGIAPGLAAVVIGDNPASKIYVRNKIKACHEIGIRSEEHALAADSPLGAVLALIDRLNADAGIHGILV